jgi:hypothetical protein
VDVARAGILAIGRNARAFELLGLGVMVYGVPPEKGVRLEVSSGYAMDHLATIQRDLPISLAGHQLLREI